MILDNMDPNIYLECLETVVDGCFASGSGKLTQSGYWEVFEILISCAKSKKRFLPHEPSVILILCKLVELTSTWIIEPEGDEISRGMTDYLSTVLSRLARNLPKAKTVDEFMTISNCMEIILREKVLF